MASTIEAQTTDLIEVGKMTHTLNNEWDIENMVVLKNKAAKNINTEGLNI